MTLTPESWVATLRARGVTVRLRGNRLHLLPPNAYRELSDEEQLCLRHYRESIKAVITAQPEGIPITPVRIPQRTLTGELGTSEELPASPMTAPSVSIVSTAEAVRAKPESCPYCGGPCVGREHHSYHVLHYLDPVETERRKTERARRDSFDRQTWSLHNLLR